MFNITWVSSSGDKISALFMIFATVAGSITVLEIILQIMKYLVHIEYY